jgi:antitoxin (DNA-binding transcriptional repressor) of toxin-antitoxin stability system
MKTVGIRALKNGLSEYVRQVRGGEEFLVTDRGEPVAELRAPTPGDARQSLHPGLAGLARRGILTPGEENSPSVYPRLSQLLPAGSAVELLAEERRDRGTR